MRYQDGTEVHVGDVVDLGAGWRGVVVAVFDTREFSPRFRGWDGYLTVGAMVHCPEAGLIHYEDAEHDFDFVRRGDVPGDTAG